jgi:hypothetical protein
MQIIHLNYSNAPRYSNALALSSPHAPRVTRQPADTLANRRAINQITILSLPPSRGLATKRAALLLARSENHPRALRRAIDASRERAARCACTRIHATGGGRGLRRLSPSAIGLESSPAAWVAPVIRPRPRRWLRVLVSFARDAVQWEATGRTDIAPRDSPREGAGGGGGTFGGSAARMKRTR